jgi:hypothetical protein
MKKTRILILVMSLCALTPALLGNAWGVENRGKNGMKQECELKTAKRIAAESHAAAKEIKDHSKKSAF